MWWLVLLILPLLLSKFIHVKWFSYVMASTFSRSQGYSYPQLEDKEIKVQ
jgi:hypothetical protein